ncbi:ComF family protein [Shewanella aestuarii]|uniref:ComF family protein n=1 Tax=Shewanella aestuarii TaxID=1028752 RepID=A0A6G9QQE8_9GAMM|nr:ComF family protein [Shewanella aestuarii]
MNLSTLILPLVRGLQIIRLSLPNRCLLCQQRIEQQGYQQLFDQHVLTGLCQDCLISGLYQHDVCLGCAKPLTRLQPYCGQCMAIKPIKVIAPCSYHQGLGVVISAIKYQRQMAAVNVLADQLAQRILNLVSQQMIDLPQVLIPVPLHPNRLRHRGFNQAWIIAKRMSLILGIPLDDTLLIRVIDTASQAGLDGKQRRKNCYQAFALNHQAEANQQVHLRYQHVAIVDDVVTTGSTVNEIAALFATRHIACQVWCLARAEAPNLRD